MAVRSNAYPPERDSPFVLSTAWTLVPENTALIIIDVQNDYVHKDGHAGKAAGKRIENTRRILKPLKKLIDVCKRSGVTVVWVRSVRTEDNCERYKHKILPPRFKDPDWLGGPRKNSWGAEFADEIRPSEGDTVFEKTRNSAFFKTDLEEFLKRRKVDLLLFAGVATNVCVESSLRDAYFWDFDVVLVDDCCAAADATFHRGTVRTVNHTYGVVASSRQVIARITRATASPIRVAQ